jgi:hypothetical protein
LVDLFWVPSRIWCWHRFWICMNFPLVLKHGKRPLHSNYKIHYFIGNRAIHGRWMLVQEMDYA